MTTLAIIVAPSWSETANLLNAMANLAKSAAWPLLAGGVGWRFRKELSLILIAIADKIPKLTRGKFNAIEIEAIDELSAESIGDLSNGPDEKNTPPGSRSKIISIARHSDRSLTAQIERQKSDTQEGEQEPVDPR